MKSSKEFWRFSRLSARCHSSPSSEPPRRAGSANRNPCSIRKLAKALNRGVTQLPNPPEPVRNVSRGPERRRSGLMKVDLWRIGGGEFAEKSDAHLCVANSESRSTDKARQLGAAPTYSNKERTTNHRYKNSGVRACRYTDASRSRSMSSAARRAAWSTLRTSLSACA
jgi:hypothetical protein